ncbi:NUDIX domain-containing protein [Caulobacter segnis]|uniref:NUDIX hydrolase n=1 Tax=Caulobacter segnis (strain ATCC 21756 / DSM 7131 / JCM 7823 / NBRC 15250 / LMG 17158 / TK0059) TaxID=509190 RepID=D5VFM2_CAUST|nr:NUDIX domain-containing protein [Caulobacter segnis]ADG09754.1 NUDIX hydrolase [Caulobacter segnis ATCC 21756]
MLRFGSPLPGLSYLERRAAFGVVENALGQIALAQVTKPGKAPYFDLPGGAVDGEETEEQAVAREFGEETGLVVEAGRLIDTVSQYFLKSDGQPVRNHGGVYVAELQGENPALKVEDDHALVWLDPRDAVVALRHDAHAWAVAAWMRRG